MPDLRLIPMCPEIAEAAYACMQELPPENGFTSIAYGVSWDEFQSFHMKGMMDSAAGIGLRPEHVPQTYYFLMEGDKAVALFKVRHYLNDALREGAGHIGYGVRKSERGKGYATIGLALAVEALRPVIDTDEVYMSVDRTNPASLRVMLKNGAYIHHGNDDHYFTRIPLNLSLRPVAMEEAERLYPMFCDLPPENGVPNRYHDHTWEQFTHDDLPRLVRGASAGWAPLYVPQTAFVLWDGETPVSFFQVRHRLCADAQLRERAGHLGYCTRASAQDRGYATRGMALMIQAARKLVTDEKEMHLFVRRGNERSLRVMLRNGAYIHHEDETGYYARIRL